MKSEKGSMYFAIFGIVILAAAFIVIQANLPKVPRTDLAGQAELKVFKSENELKGFIKANAQRGIFGYGAVAERFITTAEAVPQAAGAEAPATKAAAEDYSTTNIQVAGVDEADFVKNDGNYIYTISGSDVVITDAFPAEEMKIVSVINMSGENPQEIYVNGDRLVVSGNVYNYYDIGIKPLAGAEIASPTLQRYSQPTTHIKIYDVSDRSNPILKRNIELNGTYYNSRMIGDYVYLIVNTPPYYIGEDIAIPAFSPGQGAFPEIYYFDVPDYSYQFTNIISVNVKDDVADINNKVFLLGYSSNLFVSQNNIYMIYPKRVSENYVFDRILDEIILPVVPSDVQGKITEIRASDKRNYEKSYEIQQVLGEWTESINPDEAAKLQRNFEEKYQRIHEELAKELDKSVIHKISINNGNIEYKTKGEVAGHPLNQFSMDEYNGYFRIATTTEEFGFGGPVILPAVRGIAESRAASEAELRETTQTKIMPISSEESTEEQPIETEEEVIKPEQALETRPIIAPPPRQPRSLNHLYVLDENMNVVGKIEDLAPGERIFSARFIGERSYLVTFVRIDPLFVIDLSDPANPRVLGELKIPGVSDYLHPYDENHIIGVGRAADDIEGRVAFKGVKISLFDVSDISDPKEVTKYEIGDRGTDSEALRDHKAFLFSKSKNLLVLPILLYESKPGQYWGEPTFQGAFVFDVTVESGFNLKGRITHFNETQKDKYYGYYGPYAITRSLYMEDNLYTVSGKSIKANKLDDISELSKVELPGFEEPIYKILPATDVVEEPSII